MKDNIKSVILQVLKDFGNAEMGNRLSPYALDGLMFVMSRAIDDVFVKEEKKSESN